MSQDLREALFKLPVGERLELVQELWDSIAAECEGAPYPLTDEQRQDLRRRIRELDEQPEQGIPWEEARERIRERNRRE